MLYSLFLRGIIMQKSELFLNEYAIKIRLFKVLTEEKAVTLAYNRIKNELSETFEITEPPKFHKKKLYYTVASDEENRMLAEYFNRVGLEY